MGGTKTHFACIATGILVAITGGALIPVIWNAVKHSLMTKVTKQNLQIMYSIKDSGHYWYLSKTSLLTWCISTYMHKITNL